MTNEDTEMHEWAYERMKRSRENFTAFSCPHIDRIHEIINDCVRDTPAISEIRFHLEQIREINMQLRGKL